MIRQRVEVQKVAHVDVALTEWVSRVRPVAVGRSVYLPHNKHMK